MILALLLNGSLSLLVCVALALLTRAVVRLPHGRDGQPVRRRRTAPARPHGDPGRRAAARDRTSRRRQAAR